MINLLAWRERRQQRQRRLFVVFSVSICFCITIIAVCAAHLLKLQHQSLQHDIHRYKPITVTANPKQLESQIQQLREQAQQRQHIKQHNQCLHELLQLLPKLFGDKLALTRIVINKNAIKLFATAYSNADLLPLLHLQQFHLHLDAIKHSKPQALVTLTLSGSNPC